MSSSSTPHQKTLRILSLNTASFNDGPCWYSSHFDEEKGGEPLWDFRQKHKAYVRAAILKEDPDVVCLQESVLLPARNSMWARTVGRSSDDDDDLEDEHAMKIADAPPPLSLPPLSLGAEAGTTTTTTTKSQDDTSSVLPGYTYCGRTKTHANYTVLFSRSEPREGSLVDRLVRNLPIRSVGGDRGGSSYNFPLCVLKLRGGGGGGDNDNNSAFVAVSSVHFTPFTSGVAKKRGEQCDSRRDVQLRRTTCGLLRAIASAAEKSMEAKTKRAAILVCGDTNMKEMERSCADSLRLDDVHDVLRATLPASCQTEDDIDARRCRSSHLVCGDADDNNVGDGKKPIAAAAHPPLFTWDTVQNRFNGQGAEYYARYDRLYVRSLSAPSTSQLASCATAAATSAEMDGKMSRMGEDEVPFDDVDFLANKKSTTVVPAPTKEDASSSSSSSWLFPVSMRLIAHKPIIDPALDAIEARAFSAYKEKRRSNQDGRGGQKKNNNNDNSSGEQHGAGGPPSSSWMSLFKNETDTSSGEARPPVPKLDEFAVDCASNEHAGPVPEGGRKRFLSDHFGFVVEFCV